jgi:hypothetical protein
MTIAQVSAEAAIKSTNVPLTMKRVVVSDIECWLRR